MELTFITLHDLSHEARTRYVSSAIEDILGYQPSEVLQRPIWDFFHADELAQAQAIYARSVRHDKAAGLNYFRLRHNLGHWVPCECIFTIVGDMLVASTTVFRQSERSRNRATDAPIVRRLFASSSPRDPRYHMLSCISNKYRPPITPPTPSPSPSNSNSNSSASHEPRAALFLNRFTRSAAVIYATSSVSSILGVSAAALVSTSFYYCIEESCLPQAVACLERAKANESIAYLRFWLRHPFEGCVGASERSGERNSERERNREREREKEVEAIVSCSSDGLVVVLRRARPFVPGSKVGMGHPVYVPSTLPAGTKEGEADINAGGGPELDVFMETIRDAMH